MTSGLPAFTWKMGVKLKLCVNGLVCAGHSLVHCYLTSAMGIVFGGVCVCLFVGKITGKRLQLLGSCR